MISGPFATQIMADQGADVIKVEPPGIGDLVRPMGTSRNGLSAIYAAANRNKRSVVLDLSQAAGLRVFEKLIATADVMVQNFRPGAAERMGIGYEAMKRVQPDLVYTSISGFGSSGPHSGRRVYDPLIQAASGMAWAQGQKAGQDPANAEPQLVRSIVLDKVTALTAVQAITSALFARERGAGGQHLELSMLDSAVAFHWPDMMWNHSFLEDDSGHEIERTADLADLYRLYPAKDGYVVVLAAGDAEFAALCRGFDCEELIDDPRFVSIPDRIQNMVELITWMNGEIASRTCDEVCAALDSEGVACSKVNSVPELAFDAQIQHNGSITEIEHSVGGKMLQAMPPVHFEKTPATLRREAPALGQQTLEVLAELGIEGDELAALAQGGVLG